jgi:hypothetical protein
VKLLLSPKYIVVIFLSFFSFAQIFFLNFFVDSFETTLFLLIISYANILSRFYTNILSFQGERLLDLYIDYQDILLFLIILIISLIINPYLSFFFTMYVVRDLLKIHSINNDRINFEYILISSILLIILFYSKNIIFLFLIPNIFSLAFVKINLFIRPLIIGHSLRNKAHVTLSDFPALLISYFFFILPQSFLSTADYFSFRKVFSFFNVFSVIDSVSLKIFRTADKIFIFNKSVILVLLGLFLYYVFEIMNSFFILSILFILLLAVGIYNTYIRSRKSKFIYFLTNLSLIVFLSSIYIYTTIMKVNFTWYEYQNILVVIYFLYLLVLLKYAKK